MAYNELLGEGSQLGGKRDAEFDSFKVKPGSMADKMGVRQQSRGGSGSGNGDGFGGDEERAKRFAEAQGTFMGEKPGTPEWLMNRERESDVVLGVRRLIGRELEYMLREMVDPNPYSIDYAVRNLHSRAEAVGWISELVGALPEYDDPEKRALLALALEQSAWEAAAFKTIALDHQEDDMLRDDLENATVKAFLSPGKKETPAAAVRTALESGPTWKGERDFGQKIAWATEAFVQIGKGEAVVEFDAKTDKTPIYRREMGAEGVVYDGDNDTRMTRVTEGTFKATFPNIWALPENLDLFDLAYKKVIVPYINQKRGGGAVESTAVAKLREKDDRAAAVYAFILMKTLRMNLKFALGTKGIGSALDPTDITPEDMALLNLDSNDDRQKLYIAVRAALEHGAKYDDKSDKLKGKRPHERVAGSLPVIRGCMFSLVATVPELLTTPVEVEKVYYLDPNNPKNIIRTEPVTGKIIRAPIYDACFVGETTILRREYDGKDRPRRPSLVRYKLKPTSFRDVWSGVVGVTEAIKEKDIDNVFTAGGLKKKKGEKMLRKVNENGKEQKYSALEVIKGVDNYAVELPFGLMAFYAYQLWEKMMGVDYKEQYAGIVSTGGKDGFLKKWNKNIDVVLTFLGSAYGMDTELQTKLGDYTRVMYLAGVACAMLPEAVEEEIKGPQVMKPIVGTDVTPSRSDMLLSARKAGFLPRKKDGTIMKWAEDLFNYVVDKREPPTPFELNADGDLARKIGFGFERSELETLLPLFPFSRVK